MLKLIVNDNKNLDLQILSISKYTELVRYPYVSQILGVIKPLEMDNFPNEKKVRYTISILLKKTKKNENK